MLSKADKLKLKEMKREMLLEEVLRKKKLPDVVSNVELLEAVIQKINRDPSLTVEIITSDGTTLRIKSHKTSYNEDSIRHWG